MSVITISRLFPKAERNGGYFSGYLSCYLSSIRALGTDDVGRDGGSAAIFPVSLLELRTLDSWKPPPLLFSRLFRVPCSFK